MGDTRPARRRRLSFRGTQRNAVRKPPCRLEVRNQWAGSFENWQGVWAELIGADSPEPMERQIVSELALRRKVARPPGEISDLNQEIEISGSSLLPNDTDFVVQYGFDLEAAPSTNPAGFNRLASNEEVRAFAAYVRGQLDLDMQWADGNQFIHWLTPRAGAGQVDQMQDQPAGLAVEVAVNQSGTLD